MPSENPRLIFAYRNIGRWTAPTLELTDSERTPLRLPIMGYVANSIATRETVKPWKVTVASKIKAARGMGPWDPQLYYAISIGFSFHPQSHGNRRRSDGQVHLDVENFVKPVIDGLAAGLFCDNDKDPSRIELWNYDDSNFNTLLIHRLPDAAKPEDEGIAISVSSSLSGGR